MDREAEAGHRRQANYDHRDHSLARGGPQVRQADFQFQPVVRLHDRDVQAHRRQGKKRRRRGDDPRGAPDAAPPPNVDVSASLLDHRPSSVSPARRVATQGRRGGPCFPFSRVLARLELARAADGPLPPLCSGLRVGEARARDGDGDGRRDHVFAFPLWVSLNRPPRSFSCIHPYHSHTSTTGIVVHLFSTLTFY